MRKYLQASCSVWQPWTGQRARGEEEVYVVVSEKRAGWCYYQSKHWYISTHANTNSNRKGWKVGYMNTTIYFLLELLKLLVLQLNDYFHYWFILFLNYSVLSLTCHKTINQRYSVYNNIKLQQAANLYLRLIFQKSRIENLKGHLTKLYKPSK